MNVILNTSYRCLLTYNIVTSAQPNGIYTLVNTVHVYFSLYVHWMKGMSMCLSVEPLYSSECNFFAETTSDPIYYKVNAIDYWGRSGDYSDVVCIKC